MMFKLLVQEQKGGNGEMGRGRDGDQRGGYWVDC